MTLYPFWVTSSLARKGWVYPLAQWTASLIFSMRAKPNWLVHASFSLAVRCFLIPCLLNLYSTKPISRLPLREEFERFDQSKDDLRLTLSLHSIIHLMPYVVRQSIISESEKTNAQSIQEGEYQRSVYLLFVSRSCTISKPCPPDH